MGFMDRVKESLNKYNAELQKIAAKQAQAANARAKAKVAKAKTQAEKLRARAEADREKAAIYRELGEAQRAARTAAESLKKARMEAGDLTTEQKLRKLAGDFQRGFMAPPRKSSSKKRPARRH